MANPYDQFVNPQTTAVSGANPYEQFVSPQGNSAPAENALYAIPEGLNAGLADIAGLPADTGRNIANLGIAAYGAAKHAFTGSADLPDLIPAGSVPLDSAWLKHKENQLFGADVTGTETPKDSLGRFLHTTAEVAGGSLAPAESMPQALTNVARGIIPGVGAATAEQISDNPLAPMIGQFAPAVLGKTVAAGTRAIARGTSPSKMQQNIAAFNDAGANPSLGQASQNRGVQAAESLMASTPGGAGVMNKRAGMQQSDIGERLANVLQDTGPSEAGQVIQQGVTGPGGFKDRLMQQYDAALSDFTKKYVKPTSAFSASNTLNTISKLTAPIKGAPASSETRANQILGRPDIQAFLQDAQANKGRMPFDALKQLRTEIGNIAFSNDIVGTPLEGKYQKIYSALTDDMRGAAKNIDMKKQGALKAFDDMNASYKAGRETIDFLQPYINKDLPAKIYYALSQAAQKDPKTLDKVKSTLTPAQWGKFVDTFVGQIGKAKSGQQDESGSKFSTETFLTNWNNINPRSRELLLEGNPELQKRLSAIAKTSANIREGSKVFSNPSGTAGKSALLAGGTAAATSLLTGSPHVAAGIGAGMASANLLSRLLTNPSTVNWFAQPTNFVLDPMYAQRGAILANGLTPDPTQRPGLLAQ